MKKLQLLWNGGWRNGAWKCRKCGTIIGKNLLGQEPILLAKQHNDECEDRLRDEAEKNRV